MTEKEMPFKDLYCASVSTMQLLSQIYVPEMLVTLHIFGTSDPLTIHFSTNIYFIG